VPEKIKTFLIDDRHHVLDQRRIVKLPPRHTVDGIFSSFLSTRGNSVVAQALASGMQNYFNTMLGTQLLYRIEREQFLEVNGAPGEPKPLTSVYGASHLFRLFAVLDKYFPLKGLDPAAAETVKSSMNDFFQHILDQGDKYLSFDDYGWFQNEPVEDEVVVGAIQAKDARKRSGV